MKPEQSKLDIQRVVDVYTGNRNDRGCGRSTLSAIELTLALHLDECEKMLVIFSSEKSKRLQLMDFRIHLFTHIDQWDLSEEDCHALTRVKARTRWVNNTSIHYAVKGDNLYGYHFDKVIDFTDYRQYSKGRDEYLDDWYCDVVMSRMERDIIQMGLNLENNGFEFYKGATQIYLP